jgi:hypothetical protein
MSTSVARQHIFQPKEWDKSLIHIKNDPVHPIAYPSMNLIDLKTVLI